MKLKQKIGLGVLAAIIIPTILGSTIMIFVTGGVAVGLATLGIYALVCLGLWLLVS